MAFTEKTFSLLRESVKQSMQEDKQKNLPTGDVIVVDHNCDHLIKTVNRVIRNKLLGIADDVYGGNSSVYDDVDNGLIELTYVDKVDDVIYVRLDSTKLKPVKRMRLGRALRLICPKATDKQILLAVEAITGYTVKHYIMFTDRDIHTHYRVLAAVKDVRSCMSKTANFYGRIRPGTAEGDDDWVRYIHPCEAYNGSPNLRLALVSRYHPDSDDFNKPGQYPFVARAICLVDDDGTITNNRVYGERVACRALDYAIDDGSTIGGLVHKLEDDDGYYVAPYTDPHNTLYDLGDFFEIANDIRDHDYFEAEHNTGILNEKVYYECSHCGENHGSENEDFIPTHGGGTVYGRCIEYYYQPFGHDEYYYVDNLVYSDAVGEYLHEADAVAFIDYFSNISGNIVTDYDYYENVGINRAELAESYDGYDYAAFEICIETYDGYYYLENQQQDLYREAWTSKDDESVYAREDDVVFSQRHNLYIVRSYAKYLAELDDYTFTDEEEI